MATQTQQPVHEGNVRALIDKIQDVKIAMLTTVSEDGRLHSRPMYTQQLQDDGLIWFFVRADSRKVGEIQRNSNVNVVYGDPADDLYVAVTGQATVTRDQAKIDELWNDTLKAWFPEGKDDPVTTLIRIEIDEAEYWDTPESTVTQLIGYAQALVTGEPYKPGENERLKM